MGYGEVILLGMVVLVIVAMSWVQRAVTPRRSGRTDSGERGDLLLVAAAGATFGMFVGAVAVPDLESGGFGGAALALAALTAAGIMAFRASDLPQTWARWRLRRRVTRLPLATDTGRLSANRPARLAGTIEAHERLELVAVDQSDDLRMRMEPYEFVLRLHDGARVRVAAGAAARAGALRLLDGHTIAPGDSVQVSGVMEPVVDPGAHSAGPRAMPMGWRVSWTRDTPLVVIRPPQDPR
jgi:hypothetical protein